MCLADAELLTSADGRTAQPNCRAANTSCSESQVTSLIKCMQFSHIKFPHQLADVRALFSKARHDRLDALVQILDAGMVHLNSKLSYTNPDPLYNIRFQWMLKMSMEIPF